VCREGTCDWYAERAVLVRGADEQTTVRSLKAKTTSTEALLRALAPLNDIGHVYLIGTLRARVPATPPTITAVGTAHEIVTLTYARPEDLRSWPATGIFDLVITVQVRHSPSAAVPLIAIEAEEAGLPDMLTRHLP